MARCGRCGNNMAFVDGGLCRNCQDAKFDSDRKANEARRSHEQSLDRHEREARAAEAKRRAAMTPEERQAEDRQARHAFFRPLKIILIVLLIAAVIIGVFFGINFVTKQITGSSAVYEKVYTTLLEKYENHPDIMKDVKTKLDPGMYVINTMRDNLKDSDYYLNLYTQGSAEIQKYTLGGKTRYYFSFSSGCGDLSDKKYAIADGLIYEIGKEKKIYYESSAEYAPLLEKLNTYLPESCLGKGSFTSESWLNSADDEISAMIAYGDNITALYDSWNGYYFEKTATLFARLQYNDTGSKDTMINLPRTEDCTEIK